MRVLFALTYFTPNVSGLTIYAERLARAFWDRGHEVTVLTTRHGRGPAAEEATAGVRVVRVPALARIGKGVVRPGYAMALWRELRRCDAAVVHLPATPGEAVLLPVLARSIVRRPCVAVVHCDVQLPPGAGNRLLSAAALASSRVATILADRVVAYTDDYAAASPVLRRCAAKRVVIPPPVPFPPPDPVAVAALRRRWAPGGETLLAFASRLAAEKGVDVLLDALPEVRRSVGATRVLFAGESAEVIGERSTWRRLRPRLEAEGDDWVHLGVLDAHALANLFAASDVTVLPSLNRTESFGLVQVESMLSGTPVVASDLPGVRVPVQTTGMGLTASPGDPAALAAALATVVRDRATYLRPRAEVERLYSSEATTTAYERLLEELVAAR